MMVGIVWLYGYQKQHFGLKAYKVTFLTLPLPCKNQPVEHLLIYIALLITGIDHGTYVAYTSNNHLNANKGLWYSRKQASRCVLNVYVYLI